MLVSGAVLYSLFQLPPLVDRVITRWEPHATYEASVALLMCYAYGKAMLYCLIAGFVVHLAVRAYWVGLIGLNSVFAAGVRWEHSKLGPITQEVYRERMPSLPRLIARIDNFASIIFSFAFLVVLMTLLSITLVTVLGTVGYLLNVALFGGRHFRAVGLGLMLLFAGPSLALRLVDRRFGARLAPESRLRWLLRRVCVAYYRTMLIGVVGPILFTISTNGRRRMTYVLFYLAIIGSVYVVMGEWIVRHSTFSVTGADYFSTRSSRNAVNYSFYESAWPAEMVNGSMPSIQSDVIRDPYVRLFIPYQPERHNPAMASRCAGLAPLEQRGAHLVQGSTDARADSAAARALGCLAAMHAVTLNGVPLVAKFRFATHPVTGVDGIVAYLPTAALPHGENVITVMPPPRRPGSSNTRPIEAWVIPFWL
jgi:hypothetical protein